MIVIGVTGGIASGKSTIAKILAAHGYEHIDADALVHELLKNPEIVARLQSQFPAAIEGDTVNRRRLGELVGKDPRALQALESILHPLVREAEIAAIETARTEGKKAIVLDIPLLFESGAETLCDVVIAVTAPLEVRAQRAFERPGMSEEKFARFTARQMDDASRNAKADYVIPTDRGLDFTNAQVNAILRELGLVASGSVS